MGPFKIKGVIPKDRRVEISLPPEVPEGPVDLEVTITPVTADRAVRTRDDVDEMLDRLREFRKQFEGRDIRLSDAVIELRQEEDY
jgi:hypothetical protein